LVKVYKNNTVKLVHQLKF